MPVNMQSSSKASSRRVARSQRNSSDCNVMVSDYPPYTRADDLKRAFGRFGHVEVKEMNKTFAMLTFTNKEIMNKVVEASKEVQVYGEYLNVTHCNPKQATPVNKDLEEGKQKDELINPANIDLSGDFNQQLECILEAIRLGQEEMASLSRIYTDLETALRAHWPGCTVQPFGSITTGLGIKNSDADCFVTIPPNADVSADATDRTNANPSYILVKKAQHALNKYPHIFDKIQPVPRVNMPIVKLFHIPTGTYCDVTFKSQLGIQNSKLIYFLLHSDPRLLPIALVIKYWAKVHNISGTTKLKNYTLSMLIIFYLQQPPISILPSIQWLQKDPANDIIIDNWNAGFITQRSLLPVSSNTSSILELLGGFFDYYSKFNFKEMVVCPYLGRPIEKELFNDINQLTNVFERCKDADVSNDRPMRFENPMGVQDPFHHLHNIGSPVTSRLASNIITYLKYAANAYEIGQQNDYKYFLKAILLDKPKLSKIQSEYKINLSIVNIINLDWKSILRQIVFTIFTKMLKIQLAKVENEENNDQEVYAGTITKAIWQRSPYSKINMTDFEFQKEQERITRKILKEEKELIDMQFHLILTFFQKPFISIKMTNGEDCVFSDFGDFFLVVMNHWYKKMLKSYVEPHEKNTVA